MAEVLITLGIIAIIAAMTIPNLIKGYEFKTFEVGFKKQYSLVQNVINFAVQEEGLQNCYSYHPTGSSSYQAKREDCPLLKNFIIDNLKLKPYNGNLKDKYALKAKIREAGGQSINWNCSYDYFIYMVEPYVANDGAIFMFFISMMPAMTIIIDVNGEKGPNKWGYDVFFMGLSNHNDYANPSPRILLTDEFCSIIEKGGLFPRTILRNQKSNSDIKAIW